MNSILEMLHKQIAQEELVLPDQSPLEHFVHHNNLHHFEGEVFEKAIEKVFLNYGRSAYMRLSYYRQKLEEGEIDKDYVAEKLKENDFNIKSKELLKFICEELYSYKDIEQIAFYHGEEMMSLDQGQTWIKKNKMAKRIWQAVNELSINETFDAYPDFHANRSIDKTSLALIPLLGALLDQG